jgi:hypothetical protein
MEKSWNKLNVSFSLRRGRGAMRCRPALVGLGYPASRSRSRPRPRRAFASVGVGLYGMQ